MVDLFQKPKFIEIATRYIIFFFFGSTDWSAEIHSSRCILCSSFMLLAHLMISRRLLPCCGLCFKKIPRTMT